VFPVGMCQPSLANGGYNKDEANRAVGNGEADLVAFGVLFPANPDLVGRFQLNAPLNQPDLATFCAGEERGYTDYPFLERKQGATLVASSADVWPD